MITDVPDRMFSPSSVPDGGSETMGVWAVAVNAKHKIVKAKIRESVLITLRYGNMDESYVICSVKKTLPVLLILCASLSAIGSNNFSAQENLTINGTWQCRDSTEISVPGRMPGSLYNSLLRGGVIPDPFVGINEDSVQWVSEMDWVYTSNPFDAPENFEDYDLLFLKDVQLYCSITLNGVVLGETNNAFRNWSYSLKSSLKSTDNVITFTFRSPTHSANKMGGVEQHRAPQFAFGWDWALKLIDYSVGRIDLEKSRTEENVYIDNLTLVTDTIYGSIAKGYVMWDISGDFLTFYHKNVVSRTAKKSKLAEESEGNTSSRCARISSCTRSLSATSCDAASSRASCIAALWSERIASSSEE